MITLTPLDTAFVMSRRGGTFVRQLGVLYQVADEDNQRRLLAAFPEYFEKYRRLAEQFAVAEQFTEQNGL